MGKHLIAAVASSILAFSFASASATSDPGIEFRSLDGGGNNLAQPSWGQVGTQYLRVAAPNYADGITTMVSGPPARSVSNRVFEDAGQNLFSENGISQWGWTWGQFMDHVFGLRDETPAEHEPIAFSTSDPLEQFRNDFGAIDFFRTPAAPGTGVTTARQQINTVSSYIDAWNVYGGTDTRLEWLREGDVNGNMADNGARLLLPGDYLPRADARGNPATAPTMALMGRLVATPSRAVVAGDVRANENIALTAVHTVFAREHNRIVAALPNSLSAEEKFQIARRVVGAEMQYITYKEFLPALGVKLAAYRGYDANVNSELSNEFAVVGYRAHSMIHGEFEPIVDAGTYTSAQLDAFRTQGIKVEEDDGEVELVIPLVVAFDNPDLLPSVGLGPMLQSLSGEPQYKNDEQIDNALRSVLFQVPKPGIPDLSVCGTPVINPDCFTGVVDLGAIDVQRGRDHGMPSYNALRQAYGLAPKASFTDITGESSDAFPAGVVPSDPSSRAFTQARDRAGNLVALGGEDAVAGLRRAPLAAWLKALYGSVDSVDAFVGMVAERHAPGSELGELQLAIWKRQFEALRDGDRFFYASDDYLNNVIVGQYGIAYKRTLAEVIEDNTDVEVPPNVFKAQIAPGADTIGLVAAYSFDERRGTKVRDSSGRGNTGTASNTDWVGGKYGSALSFDGSSSSVTIPGSGSLDLTGGMTLEAWVRPNAIGTTWQTVVFKEQPTGMEYALYATNAEGRPTGQAQIGGEQNAVGPSSVPAGAWTHLAVTYDGSTETLYVNGAAVTSRALSGAIEVSDGTLRIGGNAVWPEWFGGRIDEVRIYNRALPGEEIEVDMATPISAFPVSLPVGPGMLGEQHVQRDSNPPHAAGIAEAYATTAPSSGTIENVEVYADSGTTIETLLVGIYNDKDGHPGRLLAAGSLDEPVANAWNTVAIPARSIAAGTTYWIALLGAGDGVLAYRDRCCSVAGTGPTETEANRALEELPARWTTGIVYDDGPMSAYASG